MAPKPSHAWVDRPSDKAMDHIDAMDHMDEHDDQTELASRAAAALQHMDQNIGCSGETFANAAKQRSLARRNGTPLHSEGVAEADLSRLLPPSAGSVEGSVRFARGADTSGTPLKATGMPAVSESASSMVPAWRFGEMTVDGGVAMSFSEIKGSKVDKLYNEMERVEQEDLEQDAREAEELAVKAERAAGTPGLKVSSRPSISGKDGEDFEVTASFMSALLPPPNLPAPGSRAGSGTPAEQARQESSSGSGSRASGSSSGARASASGTPPTRPRTDSRADSSAGGARGASGAGARGASGGGARGASANHANPISRQMASLIKSGIATTINSELLRSKQSAGQDGGLLPPKTPRPETSESMRNTTRAHIDRVTRTIRVGFVEGMIKPINIVCIVVGTRGDVQPFIGIGLKLKEYGHRVRIASHAQYREFVTGFGLEFYPIGGDPKVLSEFVVKHRGILPGLNLADAWEQRQQVKSILYSSFGSCVCPDPETPDKPFIADAIVANPPAYGHTHCAEKLNVPLHIVFTMPWTPTKYFPNPFARIKTNMDGNNSKTRMVMNWLSYFAVEDLAWIGMADMVKDFRRRTLQLADWDSKDNGSHTIYHSKVPVTYIWSPTLVPRAEDWPANVEVVGFCNVELTKLTNYEPPQSLADFLAAGPPPVYIGFGSLMLDDPVKLTNAFLSALKQTGQRAIIQKGWGGLGDGVKGTFPGVHFLGPAPHDWLFEKCSSVVHHGGAGTTACGLHAGKPTFIVPFFGDQPFWGAACFKAGVGPEPIHVDDLNARNITLALKKLQTSACQVAAKRVQREMLQEDGIQGAVDHLHRTIYGALLAGRTFKWMKKGAARRQVIYTTVEENEDGTSGTMGFAERVKSIFSSKFLTDASAAPSKLNRDNSKSSASEGSSEGISAGGLGIKSPKSHFPLIGNGDDGGHLPGVESFSVDLKTGSVIPAKRPSPVNKSLGRKSMGPASPQLNVMGESGLTKVGPSSTLGASAVRRSESVPVLSPAVADSSSGGRGGWFGC